MDMIRSEEKELLTFVDNVAEFHHDLETKCQCEQLKMEIEELQHKPSKCESELQRSLFHFENIKDDDDMVNFILEYRTKELHFMKRFWKMMQNR